MIEPLLSEEEEKQSNIIDPTITKDESKDNPGDDPQKQRVMINVRAISTWNVWGIPWASSKIFHRRVKWRPFNDKYFLKTINNNSDSDLSFSSDLIISCFQETWSFHWGPFMKCFSNSNENNWKLWKEKLILIIAIIVFPFLCCFNIVWDTAQYMLDSSHSSVDNEYVPFKYVTGNNGLSLSRLRMVDSGLCILSTWKPIFEGFYSFKNKVSVMSLQEEMLANKGLIYACYMDKSKICATLIFNTHLSTLRQLKFKQCGEIVNHYNEIYSKILNKYSTLKYFEFYITGDFNDTCTGHCTEYLVKELDLKHISSDNPTDWRQRRTLDHIWVFRKNLDNIDENQLEKIDYVQSEVIIPWDIDKTHKHCEKTCDTLSDHCWQSVVINTKK